MRFSLHYIFGKFLRGDKLGKWHSTKRVLHSNHKNILCGQNTSLIFFFKEKDHLGEYIHGKQICLQNHTARREKMHPLHQRKENPSLNSGTIEVWATIVHLRWV